MKHLRIIALMTALVFISANSFGNWYQDWRSERQQRMHERKVAAQQKKAYKWEKSEKANKKFGEHKMGESKRFRAKHGTNPGTNPNPDPNPGPVGAPLDGGLLILLGAAGATYFGAKNRKKKGEK